MLIRLPLLLLVFCAATLHAQDAPSADATVAAVIKEGRAHGLVMEHLDQLVNGIGPRLTGSDNLTKACEWAQKKFASWGLKARTEEWGTYPVGYNRRGWSGQMLAPEKKDLLFGFNAWTPATDGPLAGPAMICPVSDEDIAALKGKLKGAWVIIGKTPAAKVLAFLDDEKVAGIVKSSGGDLILTGGQVPVSFDKLPTRISITLHAPQYKEIVALLKDGREVRLQFDLKNEFKKGPIPLFNVIADIPGEIADEYVVVGGHIDSWDGATGTTDNGTGTATTMEAARLLMQAGARPKRTIRFMLWSGEEQGLLGSKAYVKKHPEEMEKISAVLVHDGGTNYVAGIGMTAAMMEDAKKVFAPVTGLDADMPFALSEVKGIHASGGSDHVSYISAGVPGFFWKQEGKQDYDHEHHTQYDIFRSAVPEYEKHTSMVVAIAAWNIANLDHKLSRVGLMDGEADKPRRRLGVQLGAGMHVDGVEEDSPADRGGIKEGDEVVTVNDVAVKSGKDLREEIRKGPRVSTIEVNRDGKKIALKVQFPDWGTARRQTLGVQLGGDGLDVIDVTENSAAAKAGIKAGDKLLKIGDIPVTTSNELKAALDKTAKKSTVTVLRDGKEKSLEVVFEP